MKPEVDDLQPRHFLISVDAYPVVLSVGRAAEFRLDQGAYEADMIIGCGVYQVSQFFFWRPGGRSARARFDRCVRYGAQQREFALNQTCERRGEIVNHVPFCHAVRPAEAVL